MTYFHHPPSPARSPSQWHTPIQTGPDPRTLLPKGATSGSVAALLFFLPAFFRWVLPVSAELSMSITWQGISFPLVDFACLMLPVLHWYRLRSRTTFLIWWGAVLLLWAVAISSLRDPEFGFSSICCALDSYGPLILVGLLSLTRTDFRLLKTPSLALLVYMCIQILAYSSGLRSWDAPIGQVVSETTLLRIYTTMGAATGSALTITAVFALYWELTDSSNRLGRVVALISTCVSLALLFTRGAMLVLFFAFVLFVALNTNMAVRWLRKAFSARIMVLALALMIPGAYLTAVIGRGLWARFELLAADDVGVQTGNRSYFWEISSSVHGDAGVWGKGLGRVDPRGRIDLTSTLDWTAVSHSGYLMLWYEGGFVNLLLFVGMTGHWIVREARRSRDRFAFSYVVAYVVVAFAAESCVLSFEYMILLASLISVVSNRRVTLHYGMLTGAPSARFSFCAR